MKKPKLSSVFGKVRIAAALSKLVFTGQSNSPSFVRTDALVFYESGNLVVRPTRLIVKETFQAKKSVGSSGSTYFRTKFPQQRKLKFIYV